MLCGRISRRWALLALLLSLGALPARAQVCSDPGAYCEGWTRDSTRREIGLSQTAVCIFGCAATCNTSPIVALPSVRIGSRNHIVLGFSVTDACVPECTTPPAEPCYNLGVSYRKVDNTGNDNAVNLVDCDPSDPGTESAQNEQAAEHDKRRLERRHADRVSNVTKREL